ncbi:MAG: hypothetical protein JXR03_06485 [Cyclobacteriaceae bacterium]
MADFKRDTTKSLLTDLSFRVHLGTDAYFGSSELKTTVNDLFGFDNMQDVFATTGISCGVGFPSRGKTLIFGVSFNRFFSQTENLTTATGERYLSLYGNFYGPMIESTVLILGGFELTAGLKFLKSTFNMDIEEVTISDDPLSVFNNSSTLELQYRTNMINPYLNAGYAFTFRGNHSLVVGLNFDYKYILPKSVWKTSPSDTYNDWVINRTPSSVVDMPFFGDHIAGASLTVAYRVSF